jgi:hypothetical protein
MGMDRLFSAGAAWLRRGGALAGLALVGATSLASCGSSKPSVSAAGTPLQQGCAAVSAALMNGPDPDADPIGYALAQPGPLEAISTADAKLKAAITGLADAYRSVAATNGSKAANAAVSSASAKIDAICPGAAS